ncbi:CvpA family protein [Sphingomonas baiyangensis]|uniref:CvpA family protein n=1 Tax=Sphingomonas baiyangensis TaxID=2572576 RepID=A0A4V5PUQ7_9SPHN|nr:CvpA family protein [Sphingomonas baiyangensis]TKD51118.1 CvpA family protein [Sphingomonas baiyangensis]
MDLTALDIVVLLAVGGAAVLGAMRGFVTETLSLAAWIAVAFAVRMFHLPLTAALLDLVGTGSGAAVLAFALLVGGVWLGGKLVANAIGKRTRNSILGPVDRALGFGFGTLKGVLLVSIGFILLTLVLDTVNGGPTRRPDWMRSARTYPLLNATSASIAEFVDKRRRGEPVFGAASDSPAPR